MHGFVFYRLNSKAETKLDVTPVKCNVALLCDINDVGVCPGSGVLETSLSNMSFHAILGTGKDKYSKNIFDFYNNRISNIKVMKKYCEPFAQPS